MQPSLALSYWRRQSIKTATGHPKVTLGILSLLASALLLVGMRFGTGDLSNVGNAAQEGMHVAVSHTTTHKVLDEVLATDLCASKGSFQHTHMMEQIFPPRYDEVLRGIASAPQGTWLQIGANSLSGTDTNDPLVKYLNILPAAWVKVFVEPIPALFANLEESVARWPNAKAVNVAVAPTDDVPEAQLNMYCLKDAFGEEDGWGNEKNSGASRHKQAFDDGDLLPHWADQICSFDENHITKHFPERVAMTTTVSVTAWSVPELLRQQDIHRVDVLMVDTEGFDLRVLQQIPFATIRPRLIVYEHIHLSDADQKAAKDFLRRHCYTVSRFDDANHAGVALYV
jgi:FkbM family methyltransferase